MFASVRLKRVLLRSDAGAWGEDCVSGIGTPVLRATEIGLDGSIDPQGAALRILSPREQAATRLQPGDLLTVKSSGSDAHLGKTGMVTAEIASAGHGYSNFLQRLRLDHDCDPRFVWYFLNSSTAKSQTKLLSSTSTGLQNLSASLIGELSLPCPALNEQRRIADFLDVSCDALARERQALIRLRGMVHEREQAVLEQCLTPNCVRYADEWLDGMWGWLPLAHLTQQGRPIMYGIVLPGPNVDDGVPIVKGGDVAGRRLHPDLLCRTTREIEAGYKRSRLQGGDLVIAIRGSVGEVEPVPDELAGANLTQDAARISVGRNVDPHWLQLVLRAPAVMSQLQSRITGATIKGINIWDLKRISIPTPFDVSEQARIASEAGREVALHEQTLSRIERQIGLIDERRQALVAAAVTGQMDVMAARGVEV